MDDMHLWHGKEMPNEIKYEEYEEWGKTVEDKVRDFLIEAVRKLDIETNGKETKTEDEYSDIVFDLYDGELTLAIIESARKHGIPVWYPIM